MTDSLLDRLSRATGIPARHIVGPITGLALGAAVVIPRATWLLLTAITGLMALARPFPPLRSRNPIRAGPITLALLSLAAWAVISSLWSPVPTSSAHAGCVAIAIILAGHAAASYAVGTNEDFSRATAIALLAGMCISGMLLAFEIWSNQSIIKTIITQYPALKPPGNHMAVAAGVVVSVDDAEINRRVCVWTLLFVPTVAAAWRLLSGRMAVALGALILVEAALILFATQHQTSQFAFVVAVLVFALYATSHRMSVSVVIAGWLIATLLIVPLADTAYQAGLSNASWLFYSARERVALWGYAAHNVSQNLWLGIGANATPFLDAPKNIGLGGQAGPFVAHLPGWHSHDTYLQVWYELGLIGAVLFFAAGLACIMAIRQFPHPTQGFLLANFACAAAVSATGFGMWQVWLQIAMLTSSVMMLIIANMSKRS